MPEPQIYQDAVPQDELAERACLGSIYAAAADPEALELVDEVLESFPSSMFFSPQHRKLFEAAQKQRGCDKPLDMVCMTDDLSQIEINASNAGEYAITLAESYGDPANVRLYAEQVHQKYQLRGIISIANHMMVKARRKFAEPQDIRTYAINAIEAIDNPTADTVVPAAVLIDLCGVNVDTRVIPTGITGLDSALCGGLRRKSSVVIAAKTSVGKTSLALQIASNIACDGMGALFFNCEMGEDQIGARLIGLLTKQWYDCHKLDPAYRDQLRAQAKELVGASLFVDSSSRSIDRVIATAKQWIRKNKIAVVVVDYLQLVNAPGHFDTNNLRVASMSKALKQLAVDTDTVVIVLSQLNRRDEGKPTLGCLRDSGAIEQDADVVLLLYRADEYANGDTIDVVCKIAKNRNGPVDEVALNFHRATMQFTTGANEWHTQTNE